MFVNTGVNTTISSGLVELEYIKPNKRQYINTQFIPTGNTRVIFTFEPTVTDNQALYTGGRTTASETDTKTFSAFYISKVIRRDYYGTCKATTTTYDINTKITIDANKNTTLINNSSALTNFTLNTSATSVMPIILFIAANQPSSSSTIQVNSSGAQYKFYSCKIYNNGTLVRDFIPAKRISDSKCGLWDKVNFKFYTDENGGNFTAGTEKSAIAAIGTPIEYIQSSGPQYIDSNFIPKATTRTIMKAEPIAWSAQSAFFGTRNATSPIASQAYIAAVQAATLYRSDYFGSSLVAETPTIMQITNIDKNKNICSFNNIMITNTSSTVNATTNMFLLALNDVGTAKYFLSAKLYSCQIYDGNTLVRDFIPVKTTTNIYGLWDKINKVFYKNAGTGAFTGGSAVTLTGWHKIKGVWAKTTVDTWSQTL